MWPDEKLAAEMLADAAIQELHFPPADNARHVRALLQHLREVQAVNGRLLAACKEVLRCWTFDSNQIHTHSWHDMQDCAELINAAIAEKEAPMEPAKPKTKLASLPRCPKCGSADILDTSQSLDCCACGHSW